MQVFQTPTFKKQIKKLHKNQKNDLDGAVRSILEDLQIGEMKKGDLQGIQVYKFKMSNQLSLLAYQYMVCKEILILMAVGAHENFYRDLKRRIKKNTPVFLG